MGFKSSSLLAELAANAIIPADNPYYLIGGGDSAAQWSDTKYYDAPAAAAVLISTQEVSVHII